MQGQSDAQWTNEDLNTIRDAQGRFGLTYIRVFPGKPKVGINLTGLDLLVINDEINSPLLRAVIDLYRSMRDEDTAASATDDENPDDDIRSYERAQKIIKWQDKIISAIWEDPEWCPIDQIPRDGRPQGKMCIFDLTPVQRRRVTNLVFGGADALVPFRDEPEGDHAGESSGSTTLPPEQPTHSDMAPSREAMAGRSDLLPHGAGESPDTHNGATTRPDDDGAIATLRATAGG